MKITIPELSLVVMAGISGSGKSTFARRHFKDTEVLSSDFCRGLVADDENAQAATNDAFAVLHFIAEKRLAAGRLTVVDATNVQPESRKPLVELARKFHCLPVAIVLDVPERECERRNCERPDRQFGAHVLRNQRAQLRRNLRGLKREGFRHVFILSTLEEIEAAEVTRQPLWNNLRHEHGPFDIIGDIHGCVDETSELLTQLGYTVERIDNSETGTTFNVTPPLGRKAVFLGDLVDRGPKIPDVLRLVMSMVRAGSALCVPGNHDLKLVRKLRGKNVQIKHGLEESVQQLDAESPEFREQACDFLDNLISHYVLDDGKLVVAHAGMKESMQGRGSGRVRDFALYGETTGETDEFGLPVRYPWADDYRGRAMVVYGHTPVPEPEWVNHTINIDTGCVFGGKLTALRYPERELVSVSAHTVYAEPVRPLVSASATHMAGRADDLLYIEDVSGKRIVSTRLRTNITIPEQNAAAALEVMSRFAVDPRWLIYLPPTMSPSETSRRPEYLEYPDQAFDHFRKNGVAQVVCEEKHMGSRAIVIVCRDGEVARKRFRVSGETAGVCYTRTGRRFFDDTATESALFDRVRSAMTNSGLWDELQTDWICLDCELMPWSAKAQELLRRQYAPVGAASLTALAAATEALQLATQRGTEGTQELLDAVAASTTMCDAYREAYRHYCWHVNGVNDLRLAPFHIMATEGAVHTDKNHVWHMSTLARLAEHDRASHNDEAILMATPYRSVVLDDEQSIADACLWWENLTGQGGEGMVIKPFDFIHGEGGHLVQPALKCRGRDYLRIIYGPEYTTPKYLDRLRSRGLSTKRSLALREFALGIEALERFVKREPLYRVHECVFGVLALESDPVDPRL